MILEEGKQSPGTHHVPFLASTEGGRKAARDQCNGKPMQCVQVPVPPPDSAGEVAVVAQLGKAMDESSPNQRYWVSQEKFGLGGTSMII